MRLPKIRRIIKVSIGAVAVAVVLVMVWSFFIEPNRLVIHEETIRLKDWPGGFENLKVAVISDLHVGSPFIDQRKLETIVQTVNQQQPDLIMMPGDFIQSVRGGHLVEPEIIAASLKGLRARLGVYAVMGNHDWGYDGPRVRRALESVGIRCLENDVARLEQNGQAIWLAGITDAWTGKADIPGTLSKITDDGPVILMTHNPDIFPEIPRRVSLTLAGHTHGGQVNLPFLGRLKVPSSYGERYAAGHIVEENHHLFVTTGIGTSIFPVRFRVPPEIVILTLAAAP